MSVSVLQTFLAVETVAFALASLIHAGFVIPGYAHRNAHIAETVLAIVLFTGLATTVVAPEQARRSALVTQGIALLGTCIGVFVSAIGVGPRTIPDFLYHGIMIVLLLSGVLYARRPEVRGVS